MTCIYIFKKGKNVGETCGKKCEKTLKFCKLHFKPIMNFDTLPELIHSIIIDKLITTNTPKNVYFILWNLGQTSKYWHKLIVSKWSSLYDQIKDKENEVYFNYYGLTPLQKLSLLLECGCQSCKCSRITKIHYPFPMRLCSECLYKKTISNSTLYNNHAICDSCINHLPYITKKLWNNGYYYVRFYLISEIENKIMKCKCEEYNLKCINELRENIASELSMSIADLDIQSTIFVKLTYRDYNNVQRISENIIEELNTQFVNKIVTQWISESNIQTYIKLFPEFAKLYTDAIQTKDIDEFQNLNWDKYYLIFERYNLSILVKKYRSIKTKIPTTINDIQTLDILKSKITDQIKRRDILSKALYKIQSLRLKCNLEINDSLDIKEWQIVVDNEIERICTQAKNTRIVVLDKVIKMNPELKLNINNDNNISMNVNPELKMNIDIDNNISIDEWQNNLKVYSNYTYVNDNNNKIHKCEICNNQRLFCSHGLMQHIVDKHLKLRE